MLRSEGDDRYRTYFDEAWKKLIERFFPEILRFFVPELHRDVDFSRGFVFLDKELEQPSLRSARGAKVVDKLVKVFLNNGEEQWILVHIEVQGSVDRYFSRRMFRYFYRIFDRYGKKVVSMALMTSVPKGVRVNNSYELKAYGSGVIFKYLVFRLMDYDQVYLQSESNPMALVVLACQERERADREGQRFNIKRYLIRQLYERGYGKREIVSLFEFIDWVLHLNIEEEKLLWEEIKKFEEDENMPYITSVEQIGMEKGLERGLEEGLERGIQRGLLEDSREMVMEALNERFGNIPDDVSAGINRLTDRDFLKRLHRMAIRCDSVEEFFNELEQSQKR